MSADNWAKCPKCKKIDAEEKIKLNHEADAAYGVLPAEEYAKLLEAAQAPIKTDCDLQEYYELGINDAGVFRVGYSARCDRCDFTFEYEYTNANP